MEKLKNLILDFGNVLFEIDFNKAQHAFTELGIANIDSFFAHKGHNSLFDDLETAAISPAQFRDGIRKAANNNALSDDQIDSAWNSLLIGIPDASIHELLLELNKKYRLFLLSNSNDIHYDWIIKHLQDSWQIANYDDHFEHAYFSQHMKMRKPNQDIFLQVLKENNLDPSETLFIDDSPQHIAGAQQAGINTLLLTTGPRGLRMLLEEKGVL